MSKDDVEALRRRVAELEKLLEARREPVDVTADEIRAFHKVSDLLAMDWGDFCGINDCYRPPVIRCANRCVQGCVVRCIYECSCGPCNQGPWGTGGISRFEQFGS
jgi:hypothetical protein